MSLLIFIEQVRQRKKVKKRQSSLRFLLTFDLMKVVAFILTVNILFLTASPSLPVMLSKVATHCQMSCCAHQGKKSLPKDCNGLGNPFMRCCNIFALTTEPTRLCTLISFSSQIFNSPIEKPCFHFLSDAWHPPKIV